MDRARISDIAHADHPIRSPLDDRSVAALLDHALPRGDERVLDLGCGGAEWLLRALTTRPRAYAEGVDVSAGALARARRSADERGVGDRLVLHRQDAAIFAAARQYDVVVCVGSTHALGGLLPTLDAARGHLAPGGRILVGDGYWSGTPTREAVDMLGDLADLATTVERVAAAGWTPRYGHVSTRAELDAYEWACWGSLAAWALDHPDDPDSADALVTAAERRTEWLRGYRDVFGFVSLVLGRTPE